MSAAEQPCADGAVAVILPHRERFQADGAGAVGLCVHDIAAHSCGPLRIYGDAVDVPLDPRRFVPVRYGSWLHGRKAARYLAGVIAALGAAPPGLIEIHNRPVYVPALRAAFPRTPLLLYVHNDPQSMRGLREAHRRGRILQMVDAVVCVSDHLRRGLLETGLDPALHGRVHVILNGVDSAALRPAADKAREIVYVGRLSPQKGGLLFARAAAALHARLPEWRFVLIGARRFARGPGSDYEREVAAALAPLGTQGEVTGYIPRAAVFARLSRAAIAIIPSLWEEPFCLAAAEAMSAGCAVVATRRGALPQVIADAGRYFSPEVEGDLAMQIHTLVNDPPLLARLQTAARTRAQAALDIRGCAARLDELRGRLMGAAVAP